MFHSDGNGDLFISPYDEYFHVYNPLISNERETELRRRMGEEQYLFGSDSGGEAGCCARRRAAWLCVAAIVLCIAVVLLLLHFEKLGP